MNNPKEVIRLFNTRDKSKIEQGVQHLASQYHIQGVYIVWPDCDYYASANRSKNRITVCPRVLSRSFSASKSRAIRHPDWISHLAVVLLHEFGHLMDNNGKLSGEDYYGIEAREDRASKWAQKFIDKI